MKVKDILQPDGIYIKEYYTLDTIIDIICQVTDKTFPVLNDKHEVTGIITPKVIIKMFIPNYFDLLKNFFFVDDFTPLEKIFSKNIVSTITCAAIIAKDVMLTPPVVIHKNGSLLKASSLMLCRNIEFLPVVDDENKFMGVIHEKVLLKHLLKELSKT